MANFWLISLLADYRILWLRYALQNDKEICAQIIKDGEKYSCLAHIPYIYMEKKYIYGEKSYRYFHWNVLKSHILMKNQQLQCKDTNHLRVESLPVLIPLVNSSEYCMQLIASVSDLIRNKWYVHECKSLQ